MASRVKDLDALGSALLVEAEGNNRLVESLRQFQDDMDSLNRIANNKTNVDMVNRIQQQNANSSEILKENRELKICIEDYERAMELIMQKYREHTTNKVLDSKINFRELYNEKLWKIIREQREKINEMAAVMQRAASLDDEMVVKELETMARLRMENKTLRELLQISKQFGSDGRQIKFNEHQLLEKGVQTECDDSADESSLSGASIENANNNSAIYININSNSTATTMDNAVPTLAQANENNNGPVVAASTTALSSASAGSLSSMDSGINMGNKDEQLQSAAISSTNNKVANVTGSHIISNSIPPMSATANNTTATATSTLNATPNAHFETSNIAATPAASAT